MCTNQFYNSAVNEQLFSKEFLAGLNIHSFKVHELWAFSSKNIFYNRLIFIRIQTLVYFRTNKFAPHIS
jgi:hypothetical protein